MPSPFNPPFRAEHIGSMLRPATLLAARADREAGKIDDAALRAAEDAAIRQVVDLQRSLGLSSITDGEYRRHAYSDSFTVDVFSGVRIGSTDDRNWTYANDAGHVTEGRVPIVVDRLTWPGPVNVENYRFIAGLADDRMPKITLPGPCYIHFRSGRENISPEIYPDLDDFWNDLLTAYEQEIAALYEAGCRYIQLDETSIAKLGDPRIQEGLARRGDDWQALLAVYTDVVNEIVRRAPADMGLGIHLCRGNKGGSWQAEAGYDAVATHLFRKLAISFYFLEYDTPRAGGFEPLREVPEDKTVVLGLVSTKSSVVEDADDIRRRIEEAASFIDREQLGLSPQCGFASIDTGNPITFEQQAEKLSLIVDLARDLWGYEPV